MTRIWTDTQRQEAAARIHMHRPWLHATGPRTALGKSISAQNSYKHGRYTFGRQVLRWYVRLAALRVKQAKIGWMQHERKFQNELIARGHVYDVKKPHIMAFYPYFIIHPLKQYEMDWRNRQKPVKKSPKSEIYAFFDSLKDE